MQQQFHQHHHQSALEIKEKLLQALDRDYNVVDMATALEVVSLLEKTSVTKEALETTRLGRLVNEMRKKTANEILARRAKDLVRRWRDMIAKPAENGVGGTGQGPGSAKLKTSVSSPATFTMGTMVATSPVGSAVRSGLSIPPTSPCPAMRVMGGSPPILQPPQRVATGSRLPASVISPSNSVASNASRGSSSTSPGLSFSVSVPSQPTHSNSSRPSTPLSLQMVAKSKAVSPGPGRPLVEQASSQRGIKRSREEHHGEETMTGFEACVTEKKSKSSNGTGPSDWPWAVDEGSRDSRDSRGSWSGDSSSRPPLGTGSESRSRGRSSRSRTAEYASVKSPAPSDLLKEKFASIARVSKVKTTQELLEDLARRSGSPTIVTRAETQAVPAAEAPEARPWAEAKDELMVKFLQSQTAAPSPTRNHRSPAPPAAVRTGVDDTVADILAKLPPLDPSLAAEVAAWTEDQSAEDREDGGDAPSPPAPPPVTEEDVDRLHTTPLDNVSGFRDFRQEFHEWHETLSVSSYNGDLLHLLPYVIIE